MKWLRGGSSEASEPATAPEPPSMPSEPAADTGASEGQTAEPSGDAPA
jgi:hypothetical protein